MVLHAPVGPGPGVPGPHPLRGDPHRQRRGRHQLRVRGPSLAEPAVADLRLAAAGPCPGPTASTACAGSSATTSSPARPAPAGAGRAVRPERRPVPRRGRSRSSRSERSPSTVGRPGDADRVLRSNDWISTVPGDPAESGSGRPRPVDGPGTPARRSSPLPGVVGLGRVCTFPPASGSRSRFRCGRRSGLRPQSECQETGPLSTGATRGHSLPCGRRAGGPVRSAR